MATTKESLIKYFSGLDIATLEKLKKYSTLLIIPDEDMLTNVTMTQMVSKAHELADSLFPEWTDRSKSDFGEFLVELFALFSEKDFWYINAFANEGIFRKMRSYSNAFSKASTFGYQPTTCKGATAEFNITFAKGDEVTYSRGELVLNVNGTEFSNDDSITIEKSSVPLTKRITLNEGKQMAEDVTYNGYSIAISKENIDIDSVAVTIDNVSYTRVRNFGNSTKDSCHFMVLPEEDGACSIFFGSDNFGVQPSIGKTITVEYRTCNGASGNINIDVAKITDSDDSREATLATMLANATGGTTAATLTEIKEQAPLYFSNRGVAYNEEIAEEILNSFSCVYKSKVMMSGQEVTFQCIPASGDAELTQADASDVAIALNKGLLLGYSAYQTDNLYADLITKTNSNATGLKIDLVVSASVDTSEVKEEVLQILQDYTNPLVEAEYGQSFNKTELEITIRSCVSGVQSVVFKQVVGGTSSIMSDFTLSEREIFTTIDTSKVTFEINAV